MHAKELQRLVKEDIKDDMTQAFEDLVRLGLSEEEARHIVVEAVRQAAAGHEDQDTA